MPRLVLCLAALACCLATLAHADPAQPVSLVSQAPYQPAGAQQLTLHSARLKRDYVVVISAPPPSPLAPPGRKLPAIYALDGGYGIAGPLAQMMVWAFMMQPAYVVSIGYPPGQEAARDADLLHRTTVRDGATIGGGGAAFQAFLTDDLRPFLEARYPLDPGAAILFGHSYGGLFAANVLVDAPTAFAGYVIASPSVFADPQLMARLTGAAPRGQGRRVFIAAGGKEADDHIADDARRLAVILGAAPSTFVTQLRVFDGESHISYYPQLVPAAFAWVLPVAAAPAVQRKAIAVPPAQLDRLVGAYALADGRVVTVARKGDALLAGMTGYPGGQVLAETPTRFFAPGGLDVVMDFEVGAIGPAAAVSVRINGAAFRAVRKGP